MFRKYLYRLHKKGDVITNKLGVIGGLGPIATAYFYELIIEMTEAVKDQDHLDMIIMSNPSIPDRTDYIIGKSDQNPMPPMIEVGQQLKDLGVDFISIPCITAHYFYDKLSQGIGVPIIHIVKETVRHLKENEVQSAGIMATEGTIYSGLFQKELEKNGINAVIPSKLKQEYVTDLIYKAVKANKPPDMTQFESVSEELRGQGAEVIILGCTELSLIKRDFPIGAGYLDAMEVLAMRSIQLCKAKLKHEYQSLITKS